MSKYKVICPNCKGKGYTSDTARNIFFGIMTLGTMFMNGEYGNPCDVCDGKGKIKLKR